MAYLEVTHEAIKNALFQINPDKSLGPDGFNVGFYQRNWDIVSQDTCTVIRNFFITAKLLKEV